METVDLEFSRVLAERESYVDNEGADNDLNVETIARVLDEVFPAKNKRDNEPYDELLEDLEGLNIPSASELRALLSKYKARALAADAALAKQYLKEGKGLREQQELWSTGAFYTHIGLARTALRLHFATLPVDDGWTGKPVLKSGATPKVKKARIKRPVTRRPSSSTPASRKKN